MSRLTMQEVIEHCEKTVRNIEKQHKRYNDWLELEPVPITVKQYWEHKQVAEWLKELQHYKDLEEQGRLIITDEPRKPLIAGADTLYCPECGSDLMGGFPYTDDAEMFQCRYCGQWINEKEQPIKMAELKGTEE